MGNYLKHVSLSDEAEKVKVEAVKLKLNSEWMLAGQKYVKAGQLHQQDGNKLEAITCYTESANCYKRIDTVEAIKTYKIVYQIYKDMGKIGRCAQYLEIMADIFLLENNNEDAIKMLLKASDYYEKDNQSSKVKECDLQLAKLYASTGEIMKAGNLYDSIVIRFVDTKFGNHLSKDSMFSALVCYLAIGDFVMVQKKLDEYNNLNHLFGSSHQYQLIKNLLSASEANDEEAFSQACYEYDRITSLDNSLTSLLLKAKKYIVDSNEVDLC